MVRSRLLAWARVDRPWRTCYHHIAAAHATADDGLQLMRDLDTIRGFPSGQGPVAILDMPWIPIYPAFVYALHPWLCPLRARIVHGFDADGNAVAQAKDEPGSRCLRRRHHRVLHYLSRALAPIELAIAN